jgi:long-subunit acyl-CoA synthetase (AMP-forming)
MQHMALDQKDADTFASPLAAQANMRPQAIVIRKKRRGIWRSMTWADFAKDAKALSAKLGSL